MTAAPLVSVNIVVYNGLRWLERCFSSLFLQSYPNIEIIVLENNSTDGSREWLESTAKNHQNLRLIINKDNLGFAKAHNIGIKAARGEYICLLNQDIIMDGDFIRRAIKSFEEDHNGIKLAAVQGKLLRLKGDSDKTDILDSCGLEILRNRRIISRGQGEVDKGQYNKKEVIFGADGALPVYKKDALEDTKIPIENGQFEYLDENFFMYKEDVDLAWRLRLFGWNSVYEPAAIAWHARGAGESAAKNGLAVIRERQKISSWAKFYSWKNQRLMQIKNELIILVLRDILHIFLKEILSLVYILFFETRNIKTVLHFIKEAPNALKKRSYIMKHKRVGAKEMSYWFKS